MIITKEVNLIAGSIKYTIEVESCDKDKEYKGLDLISDQAFFRKLINFLERILK